MFILRMYHCACDGIASNGIELILPEMVHCSETPINFQRGRTILYCLYILSWQEINVAITKPVYLLANHLLSISAPLQNMSCVFRPRGFTGVSIYVGAKYVYFSGLTITRDHDWGRNMRWLHLARNPLNESSGWFLRTRWHATRKVISQNMRTILLCFILFFIWIIE